MTRCSHVRRFRPAPGVRAVGRRLALMLALLALPPAAALAAPMPARRRAADISTASAKGYYYMVQPLLSCANVTLAVPPAGVAPACCTLTPLDCAKRCDASPECIAFRYAFYSDTPPVAADAPPGSLPAGGTWQLCDLLSGVEVWSCAPQLSATLTLRHAVWLWASLPRSGAVNYDHYWRTLNPPVTDVWLPLSVNVSGPDAASLLLNSTRRDVFGAAVMEAAQVLCCATFANVVQAVQSSEPNAAGQSAVVVTLRVQALSGRFTNPYVAAQVAYLLARAEGEAALLAALLSRGFANPITLVISANGTQPIALAPSLQPTVCAASGYATAVVVGIAVGLGGALFAMVAAAALLPWRYELVPRATGGRRPGHDVFLSYRRADLAITDAVHDKLVLAGLRVFYDRGGFLAGKPFATSIFAGLRAAPVVSLVVTLHMVRAWAEHDAAEVDYVLVEMLIAMHFARRGSVRLLYPLLVGEWRELAAAAGGGERDYLPANPTYVRLCEALPAVVPKATLALVASLFAAAGEEETLDAVLAAATVRDLILGSGDELVGILQMTGCALTGPEEQAGLVLRHRYAERVLLALAPQPRAQPLRK